MTNHTVAPKKALAIALISLTCGFSVTQTVNVAAAADDRPVSQKEVDTRKAYGLSTAKEQLQRKDLAPALDLSVEIPISPEERQEFKRRDASSRGLSETSRAVRTSARTASAARISTAPPEASPSFA